MSELRKDPISGRWMITATRNEVDTPFGFINVRKEEKERDCPFCEGRELETPPEAFALRKEESKPDTPGWTVRVIPSKFGVVKPNEEVEKKGVGDFFFFDTINGYGVHEIVIESPLHITHISDLPIEQIEKVLRVYQIRLRELKKNSLLKYGLIFRNQGYGKEISMLHVHSQIIALPLIPKSIKDELSSAKNYYEEKERCIFCDIIKQELYSHERIVSAGDKFIVLAPFASRFPFETQILPRKHECDFTNVPEEDLWELAEKLKSIIMKTVKLLKDPPLNFVLHTAPFMVPEAGFWLTIKQDYHWHIEILPHAMLARGFEWGGDFYINPPSPEAAAKFLKEVEGE